MIIRITHIGVIEMTHEGRSHAPVELILIDLAVSVPVGLINHLLQLLVSQVLALHGREKWGQTW